MTEKDVDDEIWEIVCGAIELEDYKDQIKMCFKRATEKHFEKFFDLLDKLDEEEITDLKKYLIPCNGFICKTKEELEMEALH